MQVGVAVGGKGGGYIGRRVLCYASKQKADNGSKKSFMNTNRWLLVILGSIGGLAVLGTAVFLYFTLRPSGVDLRLTPQELSPSGAARLAGTEVGTGISGKDDPEEAIREAGDMAMAGKTLKPDIAIVFVTASANAAAVLEEAHSYFGEGVKIFGSTSSARAVMSDKGIVATEGQNFSKEYQQAANGVAIMTIASEDIVFGVGSVPFEAGSEAKAAAAAALAAARADSGRPAEEEPKVVLVADVRPYEDDTIEAIESALGKDVILLGGTAGGPTPAIFGKDKIFSQGVSVAVLYTDLPVGWTFGNGFDYPDLKSGTVTKAEGMEIMEIDNRPALDVLDEWLGGAIGEMGRRDSDPREVRDLLALHPIYRKMMGVDGQVHFVISHPWPKDEKMVGRSVLTATHIKAGEKVFLGLGSVERLMNGIAKMPRLAKQSVGMDMREPPLLAFGFFCNGALGVIPEAERTKLPKLVGVETGDTPYLLVFSYGEQGLLPGYGNAHANLSGSFLVIGSGRGR